MPLLELHHLTVQFPVRNGGPPLTAVREVSFHLAQGEVLGLVGESGSGKSATALAILRLLPPQARAGGEVVFTGQNLLALSDDEMRHVRGAHIAMIFQEPMTALNPVMRVGDQIAEAVLAHGVPQHFAKEFYQRPEGRDEKAWREAFRVPLVARPFRKLGFGVGVELTRNKAWELTVQALREVRLPDPERRARDYPHQLSGGMRQRVMIAMAIVNRPQLLIADEPTTALDVTIQAQILELLAELRQKFALAMLFISHDLAVVSQVADRVAVMYAGNIVEMGQSRDLFTAPAHPYTRGLLQSVPTLRTTRNRPLDVIEGIVPALAELPPGCPFEPRCSSRVEICARALPPLVEVAPGHLARCPVLNPPPRHGDTEKG